MADETTLPTIPEEIYALHEPGEANWYEPEYENLELGCFTTKDAAEKAAGDQDWMGNPGKRTAHLVGVHPRWKGVAELTANDLAMLQVEVRDGGRSPAEIRKVLKAFATILKDPDVFPGSYEDLWLMCVEEDRLKAELAASEAREAAKTAAELQAAWALALAEAGSATLSS